MRPLDIEQRFQKPSALKARRTLCVYFLETWMWTGGNSASRCPRQTIHVPLTEGGDERLEVVGNCRSVGGVDDADDLVGTVIG